MPLISQKGINMPESPIRKLASYAIAAEKRGKKVHYLNIGQPDIKTPKQVLTAIKNNTLDVLAYSPSEGSETHRKKIAAYYNKFNIHIHPNDILVTTGSSEAVLFTFGSIMDEGDEIIIPEPFYANFSSFSTASGINIVPVSSSIDNNFALPPIEDFEQLITPKSKAILICNPNNPTGYLYSKQEILKLGALVKKHDLFLICDEVYREFVYDNKQHYSILSFDGLEQHAIIIDSVSKRYSMCGARIGYLVTKNKDIITTALKFAQARLSPPTLAQIASEAALDTPESYFEDVKNEYVKRRNLLVKGLTQIEGVKVGKPNGAFYCIVELPIKDADDFARWLLEFFDFDNETVMIAPATGFYATPGMGKNQIRIAYVLGEEELQKAITIIAEALKVYKN